MASHAKPESIEGGCLCGSIRYTVNFPRDHDFDNAVTTCQCEQCRKGTGVLFLRAHKVPMSAVTFQSQSTLKNYHATPGYARGICTNCGSFLSWREEDSEFISLAVGCFDNKYLTKYGRVLAASQKHVWCGEEIPGVTDHLQGNKWRHDNEGEGAELLSSSKP
ncbi:Mss4-like protein [Stachybotrys elegans]|uniref:Mss4-like protein n=1 Tax=Stachybotrys elegans TaxID=80388 RepID=A0A8K0WLR3_9HYPO|nr:Mss4-like protein [Stachybotrys elegans]